MLSIIPTEGVIGVYDEIADLYHLIYQDWDEAVSAQATALDGLIRRTVVDARSVLDVSCGIGTQALGLAGLGYQMTASDLSPGAIVRAHKEAGRRGLSVAFSVADMCHCFAHHGGGFDVVLSADNSLPHLTGTDLAIAVEGFFACLRPGGAVIIGLRDYRSDEDRTSPQVWPYGFRSHEGDRFYVFQTRDWHGDSYDVAMYFVREQTTDAPAQVVSGRSRYHALSIGELTALLAEAGFDNIERLDNILHQPVIVAHRPGQ